MRIAESISAFDHIPVDYVPKSLQRVGASILEVEVVGMFPYVEGKDRGEAVAEGIFGIASLSNEELAVVVFR